MNNIDFTQIPGFIDLDGFNKELFVKFIVNFYNAQGQEVRGNLHPTGVYYVEDITYYVVDPEDNMLMQAKREIMATKSNGEKLLLHKYTTEEYSGLAINKTITKNYLRFEYKSYDELVWVHVIGEHEWY